MFGRQRIYYNDIYDSELPFISVLIPMHNEEKVLHYSLDALLECDYDRNNLEIIPINDNSTDSTPELLDEYHEKYPFIRPLHRKSDVRGKPASLNEAIEIAKGDIIIFDSVTLFFLGEMNIFIGWWALLFVMAYNSYGNFVPFYEIATALMMDGRRKDLLMLPLMTFSFYFYLWNISLGFIDAILDLITARTINWAKTERFTVRKWAAEERDI